MKHAITIMFGMMGCSEPTQRSAFDPRSAEPAVSAASVEEALIQSAPETEIQSGDAVAVSEEAVFEEVAIAEEPQPTVEAETLSSFEVRAGESLDRLSRWSGSSVETLAALNGIEITAPLIPGQVLQIPVADSEAFTASRDGAFEKRLERYLSSNGGLSGIEGYTVRTGDNAWAIAKQIAGVPSWVLAAFNADKSLDHLSVGDTLYLPIMTHVVDNEMPMDDLSEEVFLSAMGEEVSGQP